jgi:hypothetical protein
MAGTPGARVTESAPDPHAQELSQIIDSMREPF